MVHVYRSTRQLLKPPPSEGKKEPTHLYRGHMSRTVLQRCRSQTRVAVHGSDPEPRRLKALHVSPLLSFMCMKLRTRCRSLPHKRSFSCCMQLSLSYESPNNTSRRCFALSASNVSLVGENLTCSVPGAIGMRGSLSGLETTAMH